MSVVELRQYVLHPGKRETLIDLFERYFAQGQEQVGIEVVGQFRDLDDPDRFVWLRSFESMESRKDSLEAFYYGPVWATHREVANATMVDSDNVLLLQPLTEGVDAATGRPGGATGPASEASEALVEIVTCERDPAHGPETLRAFYAEVVGPALAALASPPILALQTLAAENTFPQLPVRRADVLVWVTRFADMGAYADHLNCLASSPAWSRVSSRLASLTAGPPQVLRLQPTSGSALR